MDIGRNWLCSPLQRGLGAGSIFIDGRKISSSHSLRWLMRLSGLIALVLVCYVNDAASQPLETLNASYASVTGSRIPLWIAKDAGLFEKYGLSVNLVVIGRKCGHRSARGRRRGGSGAPGTTTIVSAAKGLSAAIIGTFGPGS